MAVKYSNYYKSNDLFGLGDMAKVRKAEVFIDFTKAANQTAASTDSLALFELPAGTVVIAAGIQQITAGSSGNTFIARAGTVNLSSTLASDATAGLFTTAATYALDGNAGTLTIPPYVLATAVDFNLLSASGVRATGKARAFVIFVEGFGPVLVPTLAQRDGTL